MSTVIYGVNPNVCAQRGGIATFCANNGYGPANSCMCTIPDIPVAPTIQQAAAPVINIRNEINSVNTNTNTVSPVIATQVNPVISPVMAQSQIYTPVSLPPAPVDLVKAANDAQTALNSMLKSNASAGAYSTPTVSDQGSYSTPTAPTIPVSQPSPAPVSTPAPNTSFSISPGLLLAGAAVLLLVSRR